MTDAAVTAPGVSWFSRLKDSRVGPVSFMILVIMVIWYAGAVYLNAPRVIEQFERGKVQWTASQLMDKAWSMKRPILPAPHQVAVELNKTIFQKKITSKRSLVFHAWITTSSTLLGFAMGGLLGILLAAGIVHVRTLDRSLMPWIIASQTIPILAIAPMIVVVLGNLGLTGVIPKAIISMYLCFFPVAIGMVKGLRSPDPLQMDLMRTYSASTSQIFWNLRWPSSVPFLFASLKVAVAISLVGAIVGELPTGAVAGLGARLLAGSYYGQTVQIWSALVVASVLGMALVYTIGLIEKFTLKAMGAKS
ncbi:MAG: ABC transporter permease [Alphaproteobacteria bacterium]|jgi:NitT/TauT family transport system permease protein|nr:ABC transporter permease [Alphaproteobacteria bacterium]MBT4086374.1 ABC transporter permease [Alphaproteobacteria bacterium]MBT4546354.1 ABC transporter permease [Alphaproteobacteria bacterium]MBT7744494.1 ABC transporter permease [Alphaproteobacteria bacterium]